MTIDFACTYGVDDWAVYVDGAYTLTLSDAAAAALNGKVLVASDDESVAGVNVTATYTPNPEVTDVLKVTYGKGSEIIWNFEDGTNGGFVGFDEAKQHSIDNGINNTLVGSDPLAGQFSEQVDGDTFVSTDIVRNGKYALGWNIDNTDAGFAGWTYNVIFNIGETIVLRDVANGKNATALGMWLYIPEGAAGLAFQSQLYVKNADGTYSCKQDHFTFTTVSGVVKNLNSCTEADIPESRWVYASINLTAYDYVCTPVVTDESNSRSPSFIRTYIKPMVPAVHTFYIDDITLDYSSAVDDRVLPTITDTAYTTQDESVALENGATINGNSVSFSAVVADNIKLDNATGKIYIDGNTLSNVTVSGKYLASEAVTLLSGAHTVKFEIKDTLGNTAVVIRNFTIAGDAAVTLGGHNDSGAKPEYDSVYYADVNVADITNINKLSVSILLQDANTWEPEGMIFADGFSATYVLDKIENILTVYVERNGDEIDASATTIFSAPIRLWSWDAINHVTGAPITPEAQYATGNCPVVTVDYRVVKSEVEFVDGEGTFGGSVSVETMINDIVNPWHVHDTELTVLNKGATCTKDGYANRTYCETCKSVIDWGTVVEAIGHKYVNGKCECGATNTVTGLVEENGNWYYYINGIAASGWQMVGTDWYYFDPETKIGAEGDVEIGVITYNFENGKLTSGVWAKTLLGWRYYYGPSCYNDRGSWREIDGKNYFFEKSYRLEDGWQLLLENQINLTWYYFNEDGTCDKAVKPEDGFYTDRKGYAYSEDGHGLTGLQTIDGKVYYFNSQGYAQKNGTYANFLFMDDYAAYTGLLEKDGVLYYYVNGRTATKGLYECDGAYYFSDWGGVVKTDGSYYVSTSFCDLPEGNYTFGADGKMYNGVVEKDGEQYLYANGKLATYGLYKIDDAYYFASTDGAFKTSGTYYVGTTYCDLPKGNYTFGADGKMCNGVVEIEGVLYLYINGVTTTKGLHCVDGEYYFSDWGGVLKTDGRYYVSTSFCDLPKGNYTFGADGKMCNGVVEIEGVLYLYINGVTATKGLYCINGEYYFSDWGGVLKTDGRYYVSTSFCDLPKGNYTFGADGKMYDGFVTIDSIKYYYENGNTPMPGIIEVDGDYYFVNWGGKVVTDQKFYVFEGSGYTIEMTYTFDETGKIVG